MQNIKFKISYHHGDAADGRLNLYDASSSLHGLAKALSITTHALLNEGAIRKHGDRVEGAEIYISPSKKGSFVEIVTIVISSDTAAAFGASVVAAAFWDLVKWTWKSTVDKPYQPETPYVKNLAERVEPFIGEITEALEVPLEQLHRPIKEHTEMEISIQRPRVGEEIRFNEETLINVSLNTEGEATENIKGNVTRFNILSGIGRFYDDAEERTISFKIDQGVPYDQKALLTWSMDQAMAGDGGKVYFTAQKIVTARGVVKRYRVQEISKV